MKKVITFPIAALLILGIGPFTGLVSGPGEQALVTRVIDGDTLELANRERVRLLGMDTPERGQFLYQEAKVWLKGRIEGHQVILERNGEDRDKYGRLLRYVWFEGRLLNLELVKLGLASVYMMGPEDRYYEDFIRAETAAREAGLGIWQYTPSLFCIGIHHFRYNAPGNDNANLNEEFVTLRNKCAYPVNMTGWVLSDAANNTHTFPEFILANKTAVTLHTGPGQDNSTDLYWGRTRAVWNNQGDTLLMRDNNGRLLLNYSY